MKLSDVIKRVQQKLPLYTPYFTDNVKVTSLTAVKNTCTVVTAEPHNLSENDLFTIEGAKISNKITSLTQYKGLGRLVTEFPHEVTKNTPLHEGDSTHITISGANEEEYNGTFLIMDIPNENVIEFSIDENAPQTATGNPEIKEDAYANFNGRQFVSTVIDENTFTFVLPYLPASDTATGDIIIKNGIRISGDYSIQNAMKAYEENGHNELWGFVVLDGANVSKSLVNGTDAISEFVRGADLNLELIQDVSFYVFVPTSDEYCWVDYVDIMQDLRIAILKSLHNARFSSGLKDNDCYLSYVGDNPVDTDGTAYAIYQYKFQTTLNIYNEDGIDAEFMPKIKHFEIRGKNNFENSEFTPEYVSRGDLPDESTN